MALFLTVNPYIFGIDPARNPDLSDESLAYQILWPLCLTMALMTVAVFFVKLEREMRVDGVGDISNKSSQRCHGIFTINTTSIELSTTMKCNKNVV